MFRRKNNTNDNLWNEILVDAKNKQNLEPKSNSITNIVNVSPNDENQQLKQRIILLEKKLNLLEEKLYFVMEKTGIYMWNENDLNQK